MKLRITTLPGDGVGPEVTAEAVRTLRVVAESYGHEFTFDEQLIGGAAIRRTGTPLPRATLDACLLSDAVLLGAVGSPEHDDLPPGERPEAGLLTLRRALGAYANLRPVVCHDALADCTPLRPERVAGADILVVRELLGGLYFGEPRGFETDDSGSASAAFNTMRYTVAEVERIARVAFEAALARRRKVTSVDKANVLETSRLWRETVSRVALDYPTVTLEHLYVDACAMHLIADPLRFDVLLTENLFGDILSDEAAVLAGSLGLLASASVGGDVDLYEPVHGSAPDIAGQGTANPLGAIASVALLLRHTARLEREAQDIEAAIEAVLHSGYRTLDITRGAENPLVVGTSEMGQLVVEALAEVTDIRHAYHAV
ncbi:MAG: 3-isopropylmalate dehydrogenase [Acidobacteriota bacterium]|jgi:3-isopropylmalate dehydrogenase|nr:3-isopropylmalate dehydrogenase [Acidobacteriota bacterium]